MPDITMCVNKQCPLRAKCYRYRAVPSTWQSYAKFEPEIRQTKPVFVATCFEFWEIDGRVLRSVEEADNQYIPKEIK